MKNQQQNPLQNQQQNPLQNQQQNPLQNQVLKEENVTKQELINKLKEELQKYMDKSSKKLTKFFSSLLESDTQQNVDIEVKDKNNLKIESLEQENFKLNKELTDIKNNLDISDKKLSESTKELITLKEKSKKELEELEAKYKKEIEEINKEKSIYVRRKFKK